MTPDEIQQKILAFARHLTAGTDDEAAFSTARERAWLDHNGAPTDEGEALVHELYAQRGTRTTFRQLA